MLLVPKGPYRQEENTFTAQFVAFIDEVFKYFDVDRDGLLSFKEYSTLYHAANEETLSEEEFAYYLKGSGAKSATPSGTLLGLSKAGLLHIYETQYAESGTEAAETIISGELSLIASHIAAHPSETSPVAVVDACSRGCGERLSAPKSLSKSKSVFESKISAVKPPMSGKRACSSKKASTTQQSLFSLLGRPCTASVGCTPNSPEAAKAVESGTSNDVSQSAPGTQVPTQSMQQIDDDATLALALQLQEQEAALPIGELSKKMKCKQRTQRRKSSEVTSKKRQATLPGAPTKGVKNVTAEKTRNCGAESTPVVAQPSIAESSTTGVSGVISGAKEDTACRVCESNERAQEILLCDGPNCKLEYHMQCLNPPLTAIPKGPFVGPCCATKTIARSPGAPKYAVASNNESKTNTPAVGAAVVTAATAAPHPFFTGAHAARWAKKKSTKASRKPESQPKGMKSKGLKASTRTVRKTPVPASMPSGDDAQPQKRARCSAISLDTPPQRLKLKQPGKKVKSRTSKGVAAGPNKKSGGVTPENALCDEVVIVGTAKARRKGVKSSPGDVLDITEESNDLEEDFDASVIVTGTTAAPKKSMAQIAMEAKMAARKVKAQKKRAAEERAAAARISAAAAQQALDVAEEKATSAATMRKSAGGSSVPNIFFLSAVRLKPARRPPFHVIMIPSVCCCHTHCRVASCLFFLFFSV